TANARALASRQAGAFPAHRHQLLGELWDTVSGTSQMQSSGGKSGFGNSRWTETAGAGSETRPMNVAFHPRIHV
ncbi:phage tail protein, partial [Achromobacter xylosoxidans]